MSVADELTALSTNISSAYDAIETKGGTIPANKNTENLATTIGTIPSGGGGVYVETTSVGEFSGVGPEETTFTLANLPTPIRCLNLLVEPMNSEVKQNGSGLKYRENKISVNNQTYTIETCDAYEFTQFNTSGIQEAGDATKLYGSAHIRWSVQSTLAISIKFGSRSDYRTVSFTKKQLTKEYENVVFTKEPSDYSINPANHEFPTGTCNYTDNYSDPDASSTYVSSYKDANGILHKATTAADWTDEIINNLIFRIYGGQYICTKEDSCPATLYVSSVTTNGEDVDTIPVEFNSRFDCHITQPQITNLVNGVNTVESLNSTSSTNIWGRYEVVTGTVDITTYTNRGWITVDDMSIGEIYKYYAFGADGTPELPTDVMK